MSEQIRDLQEYRDGLDQRFSDEIAAIDKQIYKLRLAKAGLNWNNKPSETEKAKAALNLVQYADSIGKPITAGHSLDVINVISRGLRSGYKSWEVNVPSIAEMADSSSATIMEAAFLIGQQKAEAATKTKGEYVPIKQERIIVDPCYVEHKVSNLKAFCEQEGLSYAAMKRVCNPNNRQKTHKGYSSLSLY